MYYNYLTPWRKNIIDVCYNFLPTSLYLTCGMYDSSGDQSLRHNVTGAVFRYCRLHREMCTALKKITDNLSFRKHYSLQPISNVILVIKEITMMQ